MTHRPPITCRRRHQQSLYNSCKGQVWLRTGQSGEAAEPGVCWADSPQDPLGMEQSTRQRCWLDNQFLKSSYSHHNPPLCTHEWGVSITQSEQSVFVLAGTVKARVQRGGQGVMIRDDIIAVSHCQAGFETVRWVAAELSSFTETISAGIKIVSTRLIWEITKNWQAHMHTHTFRIIVYWIANMCISCA